MHKTRRGQTNALLFFIFQRKKTIIDFSITLLEIKFLMMFASLKSVLIAGTIVSGLFPLNAVIADTSSDFEKILRRLNQLENEVTSLKKQLKEKTETVNNTKNSDSKNNFYISGGLGLMNDPYMLDADRPNEENKGVTGHFNKSKLDGLWSADVALGYKFNKNIRGEISYAFNLLDDNSAPTDTNGGTGYLGLDQIDTHSLFASVYYDFPNSSKFTPYFGGGLGTTFIDTDGNYQSRKHNDLTFGYQGKLGVSYELKDSTDLFAEGIYQSTKSFKMSSYVSQPIDIYSTRLGIRYKF